MEKLLRNYRKNMQLFVISIPEKVSILFPSLVKKMKKKTTNATVKILSLDTAALFKSYKLVNLLIAYLSY